MPKSRDAPHTSCTDLTCRLITYHHSQQHLDQNENYIKHLYWMIQQDSWGRISFSFCLVMRDCGVCGSGPVQSGLFFSAWENVATGVSESALLRVPALCSPPRLCAAGRTQSSHQQSPCIISATLHPLHPHHSQRKSFKAFFPSSSTKPLYLSNGNKGSQREDENRENSPQRKRVATSFAW